LNTSGSQQGHKFLDAMRGMTNRKKRNRHSLLSSSAHYDEYGPVGPQGIRVAAGLAAAVEIGQSKTFWLPSNAPRPFGYGQNRHSTSL
jgi:hypothetical protein